MSRSSDLNSQPLTDGCLMSVLPDGQQDSKNSADEWPLSIRGTSYGIQHQ